MKNIDDDAPVVHYEEIPEMVLIMDKNENCNDDTEHSGEKMHTDDMVKICHQLNGWTW